MKLTSGQLGLQVNLSRKAINRGFRIKDGKLCKYTKEGRKRNHWINGYRKFSRKHLKDKCENRRCTTIHNLTIHHKIPLSSAKSEEELIRLCELENCQTLCEKCHKELEQRIALKRNKVLKVKLVNLVKSKILSSESVLKLEQDEWGSYRII